MLRHLLDTPRFFDRVIVATARSQGLSLLTKDQAITDSGLVPVIW